MRRGSKGDNGDSNGVPILVDTVLMDRQQRRGDSDDDIHADEDPFTSDLILGGLDRLISVLLHGPGAVNCADRFKNLSMDLTFERTRVRRRERVGGQRIHTGYFHPSLLPLIMWTLLSRAAW